MVTTNAIRLRHEEDAIKLLKETDRVIFDCDGVIWRGTEAIKGAKLVVSNLRKEGKQLFFLTNSSTRSRESLRAKFAKIGIDVSANEVLGSAYLLARYLLSINWHSNYWVYVVGGKGIAEELDAVGIKCFGTVI